MLPCADMAPGRSGNQDSFLEAAISFARERSVLDAEALRLMEAGQGVYSCFELDDKVMPGCQGSVMVKVE